MLAQFVGLPVEAMAEVVNASLPSEAGARIKLIGQVVWCLSGTYDAEGIRLWFGRRRSQLKGSSPAELLVPGWVADSPTAKMILDLAKALTLPGCGV